MDKYKYFFPCQKAHEANDKAVISAYGWKQDISETEIVARLMQMYQEMAK